MKTAGIFLTTEELRPKRATAGSAGYDFVSPDDVVIGVGQTVKFKTGVRVQMAEGYVLNLYIRSSLGLKHGLSLPNSVAVIDSDYGDEIIAAIKNDSQEVYHLKKGERYMQGIFTKYYVTEDDEPVSIERNGGVGSTGK